MLGTVNAATSIREHHRKQADNAAMSTLMRTLRNLRRVGFKVRVTHSL
jgi:hypothetical protein